MLVEIPDAFVCPISKDLMREPVITATGQTYERVSIEEWYKQSSTDPVTNTVVASKVLTPNVALKKAISSWLEEQQRHQEPIELKTRLASRHYPDLGQHNGFLQENVSSNGGGPPAQAPSPYTPARVRELVSHLRSPRMGTEAGYKISCRYTLNFHLVRLMSSDACQTELIRLQGPQLLTSFLGDADLAGASANVVRALCRTAAGSAAVRHAGSGGSLVKLLASPQGETREAAALALAALARSSPEARSALLVAVLNEANLIVGEARLVAPVEPLTTGAGVNDREGEAAACLLAALTEDYPPAWLGYLPTEGSRSPNCLARQLSDDAAHPAIWYAACRALVSLARLASNQRQIVQELCTALLSGSMAGGGADRAARCLWEVCADTADSPQGQMPLLAQQILDREGALQAVAAAVRGGSPGAAGLLQLLLYRDSKPRNSVHEVHSTDAVRQHLTQQEGNLVILLAVMLDNPMLDKQAAAAHALANLSRLPLRPLQGLQPAHQFWREEALPAPGGAEHRRGPRCPHTPPALIVHSTALESLLRLLFSPSPLVASPCLITLANLAAADCLEPLLEMARNNVPYGVAGLKQQLSRMLVWKELSARSREIARQLLLRMDRESSPVELSTLLMKPLKEPPVYPDS